METERAQVMIKDLHSADETTQGDFKQNHKYHLAENSQFLFKTSDLLMNKFISQIKGEADQNSLEIRETKSEILNDVGKSSVDSIFGADDDSFGFGDSDSEDDLLGDLTGTKAHVVTQKTERVQVTEETEFNFDDFGDQNHTYITETHVGQKSQRNNQPNAMISNKIDETKNQDLELGLDEGKFFTQKIEYLKQILDSVGTDDWFLVGRREIEVNAAKAEVLRKSFSNDRELEFVKISEDTVDFYSERMEVSFSVAKDRITGDMSHLPGTNQFIWHLDDDLFAFYDSQGLKNIFGILKPRNASESQYSLAHFDLPLNFAQQINLKKIFQNFSTNPLSWQEVKISANFIRKTETQYQTAISLTWHEHSKSQNKKILLNLGNLTQLTALSDPDTLISLEKSKIKKEAQMDDWLTKDVDSKPKAGTTDLETDASFHEKENLGTEVFLEQRKLIERTGFSLSKVISKNGKTLQMVTGNEMNITICREVGKVRIDCVKSQTRANLVAAWSQLRGDRHFLDSKLLFTWEEVFGTELTWGLALQMLWGIDTGRSGSSKLLPDDSETKFELEKLDLLVGDWPTSWKRQLQSNLTEHKDSNSFSWNLEQVLLVFKNKKDKLASFQNSAIFKTEHIDDREIDVTELKSEITGSLIRRFCRLSSERSKNSWDQIPKSVVEEFFASLSFIRSKLFVESYGKDLDPFSRLFFEKYLSNQFEKQGFSGEELILELNSELQQSDPTFDGKTIVDWVVKRDRQWVLSKMESFWLDTHEQHHLFGFGDLYALRCSNTQKFVMDFFADQKKGGSLDWKAIHRLGLPLWIDEDQKLKQLITLLASQEFAKTQSAEIVMFWYILLGKKALLASLYEKDMGGGQPKTGAFSKVKNARDQVQKNKKTAKFLRSDFSLPKIKKRTLSIAFDKKREQKFEVAMGLFMLAGDPASAIQIALKDQKDAQLAVLILRLTDPAAFTSESRLEVLHSIFIEPLSNTPVDFTSKSSAMHDLYQITQSLQKPFLSAFFWEFAQEPELAIRLLGREFELTDDASCSIANPQGESQIETNFGISLKSWGSGVMRMLKMMQAAPEFKQRFENVQDLNEEQYRLKLAVRVLGTLYPRSGVDTGLDPGFLLESFNGPNSKNGKSKMTKKETEILETQEKKTCLSGLGQGPRELMIMGCLSKLKDILGTERMSELFLQDHHLVDSLACSVYNCFVWLFNKLDEKQRRFGLSTCLRKLFGLSLKFLAPDDDGSQKENLEQNNSKNAKLTKTLLQIWSQVFQQVESFVMREQLSYDSKVLLDLELLTIRNQLAGKVFGLSQQTQQDREMMGSRDLLQKAVIKRNLGLQIIFEARQSLEKWSFDAGTDMTGLTNLKKLIKIVKNSRQVRDFLVSQKRRVSLGLNNSNHSKTNSLFKEKYELKDDSKNIKIQVPGPSSLPIDTGKTLEKERNVREALKDEEKESLISDINQSCLALIMFLCLESGRWGLVESLAAFGPHKYGLGSPDLDQLIAKLERDWEALEQGSWSPEAKVEMLRVSLPTERSERKRGYHEESVVAGWRRYDNSSGFARLAVQMHYIEGLMRKWPCWFDVTTRMAYDFSESHQKTDLRAVNIQKLLAHVLKRKAKLAEAILDSLPEGQRIRLLRETRLVLGCCKSVAKRSSISVKISHRSTSIQKNKKGNKIKKILKSPFQSKKESKRTSRTKIQANVGLENFESDLELKLSDDESFEPTAHNQGMLKPSSTNSLSNVAKPIELSKVLDQMVEVDWRAEIFDELTASQEVEANQLENQGKYRPHSSRRPKSGQNKPKNRPHRRSRKGSDHYLEVPMDTYSLRRWLKRQAQQILLETPSSELGEVGLQTKNKLWGYPVELFKGKSETKGYNFPNIGKKKRTKRTQIFLRQNQTSAVEVYFLAAKKLRKAGLMASLFQKMRKSKGFNLGQEDDTDSFAHVQHQKFDFEGQRGSVSGVIGALRHYFAAEYAERDQGPRLELPKNLTSTSSLAEKKRVQLQMLIEGLNGSGFQLLNRSGKGESQIIFNAAKETQTKIETSLIDISKINPQKDKSSSISSFDSRFALKSPHKFGNSTLSGSNQKSKSPFAGSGSKHLNRSFERERISGVGVLDSRSLQKILFLASRQMQPVKILDRSRLSVFDEDLLFRIGSIFSGFLFSPLHMDVAFENLERISKNEELPHETGGGEISAPAQTAEVDGQLVVHLEPTIPSLHARRLCRRESTKFGGLTKEEEAYSRVVDKVLDSRSHKLFQQASILDMVRHPQLPLLFLICEKTLSVLSCSTMAVINDFTPSDCASLTSLRIDPQGGKVLLVDQKQVMIVLKIKDFGRSICEIARIHKRQISDSVFISPGCQAILVVPDGLLLLSFIGTRLEYCARYDKKDFSVSWGARLWSETLGAPFKVHAPKGEKPDKLRRELQTKMAYQRPPSLATSRLRVSEKLKMLMVISESTRQILFFSIRPKTPAASLTHHNIKLLGVLYLAEDSRLVSDCVSMDGLFLYVCNRAGRVLKIDIQKREVMEEADEVIQGGCKYKIIGMVQFGKFLLLLNDHNALSMISF